MRHMYLWAIETAVGWSANITSSNKPVPPPRMMYGTHKAAQDQREHAGRTQGDARIRRFLAIELPEDRELSEADLAVLKDYLKQMLG